MILNFIDTDIEKMLTKGTEELLNPIGSCFNTVTYNVLKHPLFKNLVACHGIGKAVNPANPDEAGMDIGHAWLEMIYNDTTIAIDTTYGFARPAKVYRDKMAISYSVSYSRLEFLVQYKKNKETPFDPRIKKVINDTGKRLGYL